MFESFKENKGAYIWKTSMMNILPKLLLFLGTTALATRDLREVVKRIPEYDKANSTVIPLYLNSKGKAVYLRIPQDYEGQFFGSFAWKLAHAEFIGQRSALESVANLNPYRVHPILQAAHSLYQYYIQNINPVDDWRGTISCLIV